MPRCKCKSCVASRRGRRADTAEEEIKSGLDDAEPIEAAPEEGPDIDMELWYEWIDSCVEELSNED